MQRRTTSHSTIVHFTRLMALFLLAAMFLSAAPVAYAAEGASDCMEQAHEGVICPGPQELVELDPSEIQTKPAITEVKLIRPCPYPVGEGVICTGPTIPETEPPAPSATLDEAPLFIPLVSG